MTGFPQVTFGIIVLNGEPFTRYNLRSLYPFAHEIIVVEGASPKAASIATPNGHSIDYTLETLYRFKEQEDTEDKVTIVTAEDHGYPNGFWPGEKDEQSKAYAMRATGDYLWQVDIDEFYKPGHIQEIMDLLKNNPDITQITIPGMNFWGGFDYLVDGLFLQQFYSSLGGGVPRIFRWGPGFTYVTHRPPTVVDANGVDARSGRWIKGSYLASQGIYCFHYATVFPEGVSRKISYYQRQGWEKHDKLDEWLETNYRQIQRPFHVHHVLEEISWLARFKGTHPPQIQQLLFDIENGELTVSMRPVDDIEKLLSSNRYRLGALCFHLMCPLLLKLRRRYPRLERLVEHLIEKAFSPSITEVQ